LCSLLNYEKKDPKVTISFKEVQSGAIKTYGPFSPISSGKMEFIADFFIDKRMGEIKNGRQTHLSIILEDSGKVIYSHLFPLTVICFEEQNYRRYLNESRNIPNYKMIPNCIIDY